MPVWYFSDIPPALTNVGYRGQSGHDAKGPLCRLMTQSGQINGGHGGKDLLPPPL
jgi:hypothetical protein